MATKSRSTSPDGRISIPAIMALMAARFSAMNRFSAGLAVKAAMAASMTPAAANPKLQRQRAEGNIPILPLKPIYLSAKRKRRPAGDSVIKHQSRWAIYSDGIDALCLAPSGLLHHAPPTGGFPAKTNIPPAIVPFHGLGLTPGHHHAATKHFEVALLFVVEAGVQWLGRFRDRLEVGGALSHAAGHELHTLDGDMRSPPSRIFIIFCMASMRDLKSSF